MKVLRNAPQPKGLNEGDIVEITYKDDTKAYYIASFDRLTNLENGNTRYKNNTSVGGVSIDLINDAGVQFKEYEILSKEDYVLLLDDRRAY